MDIEQKLDIPDKQKFFISEDDDFNRCLSDIYIKSNVGDIIEYISFNQKGFRTYEITLNKFNQKIIKEIGDIYGLYNEPNRFESC